MPTVKSLLSRRTPVPAEVRLDGLVITDLSGGPHHEEVGGKGRGLYRLHAAGLPILPTRVVPVCSFEHHRAEHGLDTPLPRSWADQLVAAAHQLGPRLAVRSSAREEDGTRSFAGVHRTCLQVCPTDVPAAVLTVWRSLEAGTVTHYGRATAMAVLLQPMLQPRAAGVIFTINPQNGSWRELVLEAVRGQGEALVSGRQAPQWAVFRRPRKLRRWMPTRLRRVSEQRIPQAQHWRLDGQGVLAPEPVPAEQQALPVLPPATQLKLCRLALQAERVFGEPLDIEWAWAAGRLRLLQARPITRVGSPRVRDVLWTRRFLGERFPTPPTPFSWSLLEPLFAWFIAYPDVQERYLGGGPAIRRVGGYPYLNATVFRHLLFKWPGAPAPSFMLELMPPDEADEWRRRFAVRADWAVYRAIFETTFAERRWERFAWNPFTNHRVWSAFEARFQADIDALDRPVETLDDGVERIDRYRELIRDYLAIHLCSLLFANLSFQLLDGALAAWMGPGDWMQKLAVCPPGNQTLRTNEALWALGAQATSEDRQRLEHGEAEGAFAVALASFLDSFGHRAESSWEIFSPRWRDEPARLVPLLGTTDTPEPSQRAAANERVFQATRAEVLDAVTGWRQRVLDGLIYGTRRYLLLRENQRFLFDQLLAGLHRTLLQLEPMLGLNTSIEWMTIDEVKRAAAGEPVRLQDLVARKKQHQAQATQRPPVFLRGDQPVLVEGGGSKLQGSGISAGRVTGRVRIVRTLVDGEALQEGEILVAPALDPGWTPLLLRAGGLVLELGSMLSHGAVIAREYEVPGVVNVVDATTVLQTGQRITVDGSRGIVWRHSIQ